MGSGDYMATHNGKEGQPNSSTRRRCDQKPADNKRRDPAIHNEDYEDSNTQTDNYDGYDLSSSLPPLDGKRAWIVLLGLVLITALNGLHIAW